MKNIVFPLIVLLLFVFVSCDEEEPENVNYIGEYKSYNPFEGGEKLHYWVNDSEKIILNATGKKDFIESYGGTNYEVQTMSLTDPAGFSVFEFRLQGAGVASSRPYLRLVYYYIIEKDPLSRQYFNFFDHHFEPRSIEMYTPKMLDSLTVRDKTYYNVIELSPLPYEKIYYCKSDGIIKLQCKRTWFYRSERQDSITYELEKIEWN